MGILGDILGIFGVSSTNKTNKQINAANNEFNAKQAQISRDWQEEQYNKYSSPSAMVQQYEDAGLNPALAYSGGQGNTFTGSTASASSPIAMQNPLSGDFDVSSVVSLIDTLKNTKADRALKREQAETEDSKQKNLDSQTAGQEINNSNLSENWKKQFEQLDATIDKLKSDKSKADASAALDIANTLLAEAKEDTELFNSLKSNEEYLESRWKNEFRKQNGYSPDSNIFSVVPTFISSVFNEANLSTFGYKELIQKAREEIQKLREKIK